MFWSNTKKFSCLFCLFFTIRKTFFSCTGISDATVYNNCLLADAGSSLDQAIKTTVFIKNMDDFAKVNEIYATYFTGAFPARSCVEVARLPKDLLIEVEVTAIKG